MADREPVKIKSSLRWLIGVVGLAAFTAGAVAVFTTENGVGSAALIAVGALLVVVAAIGYVEKISLPGGSGAEFGIPVREIDDYLGAFGKNVKTLADVAEAEGNAELASVASEASSDIGRRRKTLTHSADAMIAGPELRPSDARLIAIDTETNLASVLAEWVETETADPPDSVQLEVFSHNSRTMWDMAIEWSQPDLVLYLDVKVVLIPHKLHSRAPGLRRTFDRAVKEVTAKRAGPSDREVLIVIAIPEPDRDEAETLLMVEQLGAQTDGVSAVYWDGSSDSVIDAVEEIRRRFTETSNSSGDDPVS